MNMIRNSILWLGALTFFQFASINSVKAECNYRENWFKLPDGATKILVGYDQDLPYSVTSDRISSGESDSPYPPPLSSAQVSRSISGVLSKTETSTISYYEPNGKGRWRICRRERWLSPDAGDEHFRRDALNASKAYVSENLGLAQATRGHIAFRAFMYFYDDKGRIARIDEGEFGKKDEKAKIKICRKYDEQDRLVLFLNPRTTQTCSSEGPDLRDEWIRYKYGEVDGKQVTIWDEWHHGDESGRWSKRFERFRTGFGADDIDGAASAKSHKGVTTIYGSNAGKLDDNSANTVLNEFGQGTGSTYQFTKPRVPLEVLENPAALYKYERRRQTYIEGQLIRMYELFKPNEHISHHRYYYVGGMWRNEQVDAKGKVTRVITVNDYRQPRPGPNPGVNDKLLSDKGLRIFGHQIYHRVYDIDAKGQPSLVAVSWNRKLRLNPLKKTNMDFADMAYGTPDGKVRWKKLADFEKFFGFTSNAAEVFPDRKGLDEDDEDD
jgi:hypothetical protein